ncbi:MAG: hypothetical protein H6R15_253 [Proteobacteria bacterium]|nr:hypothetical protein [Pseudomonadota bacterium]
MHENDIAAQAERLVDAAMGGLTPQQALIQASLADSAKLSERSAAKAKNRERALLLLAAIEKSLA